MSRPRILIPIPTTFDEPYNAKCWPEYAAAVAAAGGEAVQVPLTHSAAELNALVDGAAGILLPGSGADVAPSAYGHEREEACAEPDPLREQTDRILFEAAERTGKPLLGICFGMQSMNVFYGGTLIQDCEPIPVNHRAGRAVAAAHAVVVARESLLCRIAATTAEAWFREPDPTFTVNSSHHQAVGIAGDLLRVVARSPQDGVIEAIEGSSPDRWLLGVQWHPERTMDSSRVSQAIFREFLRAAEA